MQLTRRAAAVLVVVTLSLGARDGHAQVRWRLPGPWTVRGITSSTIILEENKPTRPRVMSVGLEDGRPVEISGRLQQRYQGNLPRRDLFVTSDLVIALGEDERTIFRLAVASGEVLWKTQLADRGLLVVGSATSGSGQGVLLLLRAKDEALIALDSTTGQRRWTSTWRGHSFLPRKFSPEPGALLPSEQIVLPDERFGRMVSLDPGTGKVRWTFPAGGAQCSNDVFSTRAGSPAMLAAVCDRGVYLLDPASGRTLRRLPIEGGGPIELRLASDILAVRQSASQLLVFNAKTGRLLWRKELRRVADFAVGRQAVYVCSSGGVLGAYGVEDGRLLHAQGIGACGHQGPQGHVVDFFVLPGRSGADRVISVLPPDSASAAVQLQQPHSPPVSSVLVQGRAVVNEKPQEGLVVWIDDKATTTDQQGRFRARVSASGVVRVEADQGSIRRSTKLPCVTTFPDFVLLRSSVPRYRANVRAVAMRRGHCGACTCGE